MPAQQRPRSDQTRAARRAWQLAGRRREQGTISGAKLRPRDLAAQDLELVAQDEQLDVLDVQATATPNERAQQRPEREVEEREGHGRRSSQPSRRRARHDYWRPSRARCDAPCICVSDWARHERASAAALARAVDACYRSAAEQREVRLDA